MARLIALCGLLTLAVGSVALARAGASGKVTIDSHKIGSATGKCPRGTGVIAGGFGSPDFSPGNNQAGVARIGSQRVGKRRLRTTAYNFGDEAGVLNSIAYCSRAGRRVRVASSKVFIGPRSAGVAVATCPGSSRVVGGGFASPGFSAASAPRVLTLTSKRFGPNHWRVEAFNINDDDDNNSSDPHPGTLIAYAYCLDDAPRIVVRHRRVAAGLRGTAKTFKVRCPRRMRALSGGFDGNLYLSANARASGAIISKRASKGRAWRFTALSISERSAKSTGYAYCVPRRG
ncbi:MAG: hypothetical protein ACXWZM_11100 [Solirubrobacterales bacterium]